MSQSTVLRVAGVSYWYGGAQALRDVSLTVTAGSIVGLIGPNGAGKSTLLDVIAGRKRPAGGTVEFLGRNITRKSPYARARLGLTWSFQGVGGLPKLTVLESLLVAGSKSVAPVWRVRDVFRRSSRLPANRLGAQACALLNEFDLLDKRNVYVGQLSGGQQRIVDLLRVLMYEPKVVVLDEPLAGVSPQAIEKLEATIKRLATEGVSVLLIEHEVKSIARLCESLVVLARGEVIADGPTGAVLAHERVLDAYLVG